METQTLGWFPVFDVYPETVVTMRHGFFHKENEPIISIQDNPYNWQTYLVKLWPSPTGTFEITHDELLVYEVMTS